jgi:anti-sigma B factor antagonist
MATELIASERKDNITIVHILETNLLEMEEQVLNKLAKSLFELVEEQEPMKLILSFEQVKYFSTSVLGMLVMLKKKVVENRSALKICSIRPSLYEMLVLTKLNTILDIYKDEEAALTSFRR